MQTVSYLLLRPVCVLMVLSFSLSVGFSSNANTLDSLKARYRNTTHVDTVKIKLCHAIALELFNYDGQSDSISKYIDEAIEIGKQLGNSRLNGQSYYIKGKFLLTRLNYTPATDCFIEAAKIFEAEGMRTEVGLTNMQFGLLMYMQQNYSAAIPYFEKAVNDLTLPSDLIHRLTCQYLMGLSHVALGNNELAEKLLTAVLKSFETHGFRKRAMETRMGLAELYINWKMPEQAFILADSCRKYFIGVNEREGIVKSNVNMARSLLLQDKPDLAMPFLRDAMRVAQTIRKLKLDAQVLAPMIEAYKLNRNYDSAFMMIGQLKLIEDSIRNIDSKRALAALEKGFELQSQNERVEFLNRQREFDKKIRYGLIIIACLFLVLSWIWYEKFRFRKAANKKLDELLHNILPVKIAEELKQTGKAKASHHDSATVLFADFVDFTILTEKLSPAELVDKLNLVFSAFDKIVVKHNLEKIKTLGDSYMCAGGIPEPNQNHANDVINAAFEMNDFIRTLADPDTGKSQFKMRFGISSGPLVAGVVGIKKFAYDIWGDTVNIAARMEQHSEAGKINISSATFELVKEQYNCVYRGKIKAKNKGEIDMFFVEPVTNQ